MPRQQKQEIPLPQPDGSPYIDIPPNLAVKFLRHFFRQFPFSDWDETHSQSRSFSVHIAAMVSQMSVMLLPQAASRMGFIYNANAQRSGKTLLTQTAIIPVHGRFKGRGWPSKDEEMTKVLDAEAIAGSTYICFDNIRSGFFGSQILEAFMTTPHHSGRVLGESRVFEAPNQCTVFFTGNNLDPSIDIQMRTLMCALFVAEADPTARKIEGAFDAAYLGQWNTRREILSAIVSLIKDWHKNGQPKPTGPLRPGFETWGNVVCGIVENAGIGNPLEIPAEGQTGKSNEEGDIYTLIGKLADTESAHSEYTFAEVVTTANDLGLFPWILDDGKEFKDTATGEVEWQLRPAANSSFGRILQKWFPTGRKRIYKTSSGKTVRVTCTGKHRHRRYVLEV